MDATSEDGSLDFEEDQAERLSAARATMAETRATIARISQQRAESIQLAQHQRARDLTLKIVAAHIKLGNLLAGEWGDFDETGAEAELRAAIGLDPTNTDAHFDLGFLFTEMGDAVRAEAEFRTALVLDPNNTLAHTNLCVLLADKGDVV